MRFLHIGQRKTLVDVDFHIAAFHRGEKIISHGLGRLAATHVHEQGLAREVEAAFLREHGGRDGRHGTGGVAETHHQAEGHQAVERALESVLADRVVHYLDAGPTGDFTHALSEILRAVVDGVRGPIDQRQRTLFLAARGGDHLQAHGTRPLAGNQAHPAGRSMEQDEVPLLHLVLAAHPAQQVLRGHPSSTLFSHFYPFSGCVTYMNQSLASIFPEIPVV